MAVGATRVVQVTNIAPQATKDQMQTLFGYLGKIEDIRLYPTIRDVSCPVQSRICYIKFIDPVTVGIAQHMTNTVFIDRALIVIPVQNGEIPDEYYALEMTKNGTIVPGLCPSEPKLPPNVINTVSGIGVDQVIVTTDPKLLENGLPVYPPLPATYDSVKIEEARRTILVHNMDSTITTDDIINFFSKCGEMKYLRTCSRSSDNTSHMLVEFSEQPCIIEALKLNGTELKGKIMKLTHATQPITKPQAKSNEIAQREIEEAMSQAKEAQNLISAAMDPVIGMLSKDKRSSRRSRSRSRGRRRRSRSRSRSRRSRSRHRSRRSNSRTKRSRSRERRRRTRSRERRRSRSRSRRSRTRSPRRSRSKSRYSSRRDRERHRSKSKSRDRRSRERSKEKSRGRSRDRERSKERRSRDVSKERRSRDVSKERRSRDRDAERKEKEKVREGRESKEKRSDRESSVDEKPVEKKRSRSRSRYRSRSRDRKARKEKRRSRSRGTRRRTPSPKRSRRRSRSRSRDKDRKKEKKDRKDKERSPSRSKVPRNYDEEEKGFDSEKEKRKSQDSDNQNDKESSEKSDNMDISNSP
ncbi:probable splicing factor, arginine/serine-rich 7 [Onthophagus taurus]|uniref:probable splicing factor, arginine/serine-rich 7 n=1 Tax=Onthophagus taurus TaxID=166361 RepID=UPI0039BE8823